MIGSVNGEIKCCSCCCLMQKIDLQLSVDSKYLRKGDNVRVWG
jgi:hypothetical protein